jgi:hypothetical protein
LTIGIVTAACAAIYSVFLVYFDWIREQYLPRWRQLYWVSLHLPFHLALVLFMHGFTQLIMWTKIIDVIQSRINEEYGGIGDLDQVGNSSSIDITKRIDEIVSPFFDDYGKLNSMALLTYNIALSNISMLPDSTWKEHPGILKAIWLNGTVDGGFEKTKTYQELYDALVAISASMYTSLFETYGVEVAQDVAGNKTYEDIVFDSDFQVEVFAESTNRFNLVVSLASAHCAMSLTYFRAVCLRLCRIRADADLHGCADYNCSQAPLEALAYHSKRDQCACRHRHGLYGSNCVLRRFRSHLRSQWLADPYDDDHLVLHPGFNPPWVSNAGCRRSYQEEVNIASARGYTEAIRSAYAELA